MPCPIYFEKNKNKRDDMCNVLDKWKHLHIGEREKNEEHFADIA